MHIASCGRPLLSPQAKKRETCPNEQLNLGLPRLRESVGSKFDQYFLEDRTALARPLLDSRHGSTRLLEAGAQIPIFTKARGQPRSLALRGNNGTFEHLAKKYGRDVTPKALQNELVQRGLALVSNQKISLLRSVGRRDSGAISAESDLKSIVAQLSGINFNSGRRTYVVNHATVATPDQRTMQMLKGVAVRRIEAVLNSMAEMSSEHPALSAKKPRRVRRLLITAMIASESEEEQ